MAEAERWRLYFATVVAQSTGLDPYVVYGWTLAEGGPEGNPLNIRRSDGGFGSFGSVGEAATATIKLLESSRYAGIRRAARSGDWRAQLKAIEQSPWNLGTTGAKPQYAALLRGTYERAKREAGGELGGGLPGLPGLGPEIPSPGEAVDAATDAIGSAVEGVADFAFDKAALALGYVVLTAASVSLFVMGLSRVSGSSGGPTVTGLGKLAAAGATRGRAGGGDIPF